MIQRRRTVDLRPWWLNGAPGTAGDKFSLIGNVAHYSPAHDREATFVFTGDEIPRSIEEARAILNA